MSKKKDKEHKGRIMAGIKPGFISSKHREKMRSAIWPYLYLLTIPMTDGDDGMLQTAQGHKYNRQQLVEGIQEATGLGKAVAYRQFNRLVDEGYLLKREDGAWEITKYQNFTMFFREKRQLKGKSPSLQNETGIETEILRNETASLRNETDLGSNGVHKNIRNKKGYEPPSEEEKIRGLHRKGMAMLRERCKERGDLLGKAITSRDAKDLKEMLEQGYGLEDIFACYDRKLEQPRTQGTHVPMDWVKRDIAFFLAERGPTTEEHLAGLPDLMKEAI